MKTLDSILFSCNNEVICSIQAVTTLTVVDGDSSRLRITISD